MLRSIAELAAYGTFAALLTAASLNEPSAVSSASIDTTSIASSATTSARAAAPPVAIAPVSQDRGVLLFAAKGCIGCHTHASVPGARMQVGPDLTTLADRAATRVAGLDARSYVRQSLRDPGAYRVAGYTALMPDLHLSDADIESLTAFLLSSHR